MSAKSLKEIKGVAKSSLRKGDTYTALFYYQEWALRKPENIDLLLKIADLHRLTRNYPDAEKSYARVSELDLAEYPLSLFYTAQMQMNQGKYEDAKKNFDVFKKKWAKQIADPSFKRMARTGSMGCDYALSLRDSTVQAAVQLLDTSINRPHIEFSPIMMDDDHLIYGSLRDDSLNYYSIADIDSLNIPLRRFRSAEKENGQWLDKGELEGPFNVDGKHVGNGVIRDDGSRMYFTLCEKNWRGDVICELHYSDRVGNGWLPAVRMNDLVNMPNFTTTQPAIGRESKKNQEIIYFVSDRPGGKGGMDIWYTEYRERSDEWREPRNAGSKINTLGTEFTPYYNLSTHELYFSSDGWPGLGGLDVFVADGEKSRYEPAVNMRSAINSPADDLDFALSKDMRGGFLVSNRLGGISLLHETCCDDIYAFAFSEFIDIQLDLNVFSSGQPIEDYALKIYIKDESRVAEGDDANPDYLTREIAVKKGDAHITLPQGQVYVIEISKEGYLNTRQELETRHITNSDTLFREFEFTPISGEAMTLSGILYEFDSDKLTPGAKLSIDTTLFQILLQNPGIKVEISSHTDSKGAENYNQDLSQRRARSVVNYLSFKGIHRERLEFKGYGESTPVAPNSLPDGTDNPEGRRLNRRTEFKVVGRYEREEREEQEHETPKGGIKF